MVKIVTAYEHQKLRVGEQGLKEHHVNTLQKFNELHQNIYFDNIHKGIQVKQYVGVIQVDDIVLQIHPKADKYADNDHWKHVLIPMLKAVGKIHSSTNEEAVLKQNNLNLLELYFDEFLREVEQLQRIGLIKKYRKQTTNTLALKGKLEFAGHIQRNFIHKERFYTNHQVYDHNHKLHQILNEAMLVVKQFTKGTWLYDKSNRVYLSFPDTDRINITKQLFKTFHFDRKSKAYQRAFDLARLILLNYSPSLTSGKEQMISLLFNMNELWEEYVLVMLKKYAAKKHPNWEITGQDSTQFWGNNRLQPDIVVNMSETEKVIIDTKWKMPSNFSPDIQDLRQMFTYNHFWGANRAILLYPRGNNSTSPDFKAFHDDKDHHCKMGYVSVLNEINKLDKKIGQKIVEVMEVG